MKITLKDGSVKEYENNMSVIDIAKDISEGLARVACAGYVKSILVKEGDYVTIGQPLVSVTQNRRLFLRAEVSEKYYPYLRTISSANFQTPYNNKVYELQALNGKLLSFGKTAGDTLY